MRKTNLCTSSPSRVFPSYDIIILATTTTFLLSANSQLPVARPDRQRKEKEEEHDTRDFPPLPPWTFSTQSTVVRQPRLCRKSFPSARRPRHDSLHHIASFQRGGARFVANSLSCERGNTRLGNVQRHTPGQCVHRPKQKCTPLHDHV